MSARLEEVADKTIRHQQVQWPRLWHNYIV